MWSFNDEGLARAIRACSIPIICGVGHETDFTIADFASDQRAPTPTAAAELATPQRSTLMARLAEIRFRLRRLSRNGLEQKIQHLDRLALHLQHPAQRLARQRADLHNLQRRLDSSLTQSSGRGRNALANLTRRLLLARPDTRGLGRRVEALSPKLQGEWQKNLASRNGDLARIAASLTHLNPSAVLARGYSIVTDDSGNIVRDSLTLEPNDRINVSFHVGRAQATISSVSKPEDTSPSENNSPR